MDTPPTLAFTVERLGVLMAPEPGNLLESEGVLNPAGALGPDGQYYLYPRLVSAGNFSRIGLARVLYGADGSPTGVERLGVALEPEEPFEFVTESLGGCEDARVTRLHFMNLYVMTYTALGPAGPHIAVAVSRDALAWTRRGLVTFSPGYGVDFNRYFDKDALLFPEPVRAPDGRLSLALLHRPVYEVCPDTIGHSIGPAPVRAPEGIIDDRPSMWISYCPLDRLGWLDGEGEALFGEHHLLAAPLSPWEAYRIGGGTVPIATPSGWFTLYHGVELYANGDRCYRAGALLLDRDDPRRIIARSDAPVFGPVTEEERVGMVANVCFPTAIDPRDGGFDVYYGAADSVICVAHLRAASIMRVSDVA